MFGSALLGTAEHTARPWRIHEFANDFRVLDVWALPTPGGPGDFPHLARLMATFDPAETSSVVRALFAIPGRSVACSASTARKPVSARGLSAFVIDYRRICP